MRTNIQRTENTINRRFIKIDVITGGDSFQIYQRPTTTKKSTTKQVNQIEVECANENMLLSSCSPFNVRTILFLHAY